MDRDVGIKKKEPTTQAPAATVPQQPTEAVAPVTEPAEEMAEPTAEPTEATEPEQAPQRTTQVPDTFYEVPEYYQSDYPDVMFGNGTIATSGCSITSLAMVATYLTEHVYMPDELADYFGGYIGNNMERL